LREIRDVLADGYDIKASTYKDAHRAHENALRALRDSMRSDLGNRPLPYDDREPQPLVTNSDDQGPAPHEDQ
jgi:hypothetical protein